MRCFKVRIEDESIKIYNIKGFDIESALKEIEKIKDSDIYNMLGDFIILIEEHLIGIKNPALKEFVKQRAKRMIEFSIDNEEIIIATDSLYGDTDDILIYIFNNEIKAINTENALLIAKALIYYNMQGSW